MKKLLPLLLVLALLLFCSATIGEECQHQNIDYDGGYQSNEYYHYYMCLDCGQPNTYEGYGQHSWEITNIVSPTCNAVGVTYSICSICNVEKGESTPATGHTPGADVIVTAPTCTEGGISETPCVMCGTLLSTNVVPANGHTLIFEHDETSHWGKCETCGISMDGYPVEPHRARCDYGEGECFICGRAGSYTMDHLVAEYTYVAETCTEAGYREGVCTSCNETVKEITYEAKGHVWDFDQASNASAGCAGSGELHYVCVDCGETKTEATTATGHSLRRVYDDQKHWYQCVYCGMNEATTEVHWRYCSGTANLCVCGYTGSADFSLRHRVENWTYIPGDCTTYETRTGSCVQCGETATEQVGTEYAHIWMYYNTVFATCIEDGYEEKVCDVCGLEEIGVVPAHGIHEEFCDNPGVCRFCGRDDVTIYGGSHTKMGSMQFDETNHWTFCAGCNDYGYYPEPHDLPSEGEGTCWCGYSTVSTPCEEHSWNYISTYADSDYHGFRCTVCGELGELEQHAASCIDSTYCPWCGGTGITSSGYVAHNVLGTWEYTEELHWLICSDCNAKVSEDSHYIWCETGNGRCFGCGYAHPDPESITNHAWSTSGTVEPTCTTDGIELQTCYLCNSNRELVYAPATGHGRHITNTVPATCTEVGYEYYTCPTCGEEGVTELSPLHHNYVTVTVDATCTVDGSVTTACQNCGDETVEVIPATGHTMGDPVTVEATCTVDGSITATCTTCGEAEVEVLPAPGHAMGDAVTVEATCTVDGSVTTTCTVCGESEVEVLPAAGHVMGDPVTVEATCTTDGSVTAACTVCGETSTETLPATGHAWTEARVEPTCTEAGSITSTCTVCGETSVEVLPAVGHAWNAVRVEPTCTEAGSVTATCTVCGETSVETLAAAGHQFEDGVNTAPTCTEDGLQQGVCIVCGLTIDEVLPATGHAFGEPVIVPVTCTQSGSTTITCTVCGYSEVTEAHSAGHIWSTPVTTAATCEQVGTEVYTCEACGATSTTELPATGHSWLITIDGGRTCTACGLVEEAVVTLKPVENVVFTPAEDVVVDDGAALIVNEPEEPAEEVVPEVIKEVAQKVYLVDLVKDGESIDLTGSIQLAIEMEEDFDLTDLVLVLIKPDGTIVEIEYEVIEGKLVFSTEELGMFALIEKTELL